VEWNVPSFATEFGGCDVWEAMAAAGKAPRHCCPCALRANKSASNIVACRDLAQLLALLLLLHDGPELREPTRARGYLRRL